jgi:hypothetical protein
MRLAVAALALLIATPSPAYAFGIKDPDRPPPRRARPLTSQPAQLPPGLYRVTDVYVADVVTRAGDLTTYSTTTAHQTTDTYARVLEEVATGMRSRYDGASFNGRAALSDGMPVAGTYYQNYVFDGAGFRPVSVVFFQDDLEVVRRRAAPPSGGSIPPMPSSSPPPQRSTPSPPPAARPLPTVGPITIGVDPSGGAGALDRIEVARGARYAFRVNARGPARLVAWAIVAGVNDAYNAPGWHDATEALSGQWLRLAVPGRSWELTLRVRVATPAGLIERDGLIAVWVRSPAVVE